MQFKQYALIRNGSTQKINVNNNNNTRNNIMRIDNHQSNIKDNNKQSHSVSKYIDQITSNYVHNNTKSKQKDHQNYNRNYSNNKQENIKIIDYQITSKNNQDYKFNTNNNINYNIKTNNLNIQNHKTTPYNRIQIHQQYSQHPIIQSSYHKINNYPSKYLQKGSHQKQYQKGFHQNNYTNRQYTQNGNNQIHQNSLKKQHDYLYPQQDNTNLIIRSAKTINLNQLDIQDKFSQCPSSKSNINQKKKTNSFRHSHLQNHQYTSQTFKNIISQSHNIIQNYRKNHNKDYHNTQLEKSTTSFQRLSQKKVVLILYLQNMINKRKRYCFQLLRQFFDFSDQQYSQPSSLDQNTWLMYNDQKLHTLSKIYQTKILADKLWAFLNLKFWQLYKNLNKLTIKIEYVTRKIQKLKKKQSFNNILLYANDIANKKSQTKQSQPSTPVQKKSSVIISTDKNKEESYYKKGIPNIYTVSNSVRMLTYQQYLRQKQQRQRQRQLSNKKKQMNNSKSKIIEVDSMITISSNKSTNNNQNNQRKSTTTYVSHKNNIVNNPNNYTKNQNRNSTYVSHNNLQTKRYFKQVNNLQGDPKIKRQQDVKIKKVQQYKKSTINPHNDGVYYYRDNDYYKNNVNSNVRHYQNRYQQKNNRKQQSPHINNDTTQYTNRVNSSQIKTHHSHQYCNCSCHHNGEQCGIRQQHHYYYYYPQSQSHSNTHSHINNNKTNMNNFNKKIHHQQSPNVNKSYYYYQYCCPQHQNQNKNINNNNDVIYNSRLKNHNVINQRTYKTIDRNQINNRSNSNNHTNNNTNQYYLISNASLNQNSIIKTHLQKQQINHNHYHHHTPNNNNNTNTITYISYKQKQKQINHQNNNRISSPLSINRTNNNNIYTHRHQFSNIQSPTYNQNNVIVPKLNISSQSLLKDKSISDNASSMSKKLRRQRNRMNQKRFNSKQKSIQQSKSRLSIKQKQKQQLIKQLSINPIKEKYNNTNNISSTARQYYASLNDPSLNLNYDNNRIMNQKSQKNIIYRYQKQQKPKRSLNKDIYTVNNNLNYDMQSRINYMNELRKGFTGSSQQRSNYRTDSNQYQNNSQRNNELDHKQTNPFKIN